MTSIKDKLARKIYLMSCSHYIEHDQTDFNYRYHDNVMLLNKGKELSIREYIKMRHLVIKIYKEIGSKVRLKKTDYDKIDPEDRRKINSIITDIIEANCKIYKHDIREGFCFITELVTFVNNTKTPLYSAP